MGDNVIHIDNNMIDKSKTQTKYIIIHRRIIPIKNIVYYTVIYGL